MSEPFGLHVEFTAKPGRGNELAAALLDAADGACADPACRLYVVSRSPASADTIWVTEAWTSREAHDAALKDERAQGLIQRALPLIEGRPAATEMRPVGGKGL